MKKIITIFSIIFTSVCMAQSTIEKTVVVSQTEITVKETLQQNLKKVALFVRDESNAPELAKKSDTLESNISARLNNMVFEVISHNLLIQNLENYLNNGNAQNKSIAEGLKSGILSQQTADTKLFQSASGLRIAELIGADYVVVVSLASFGSEKKSFQGYGVKTDSTDYILQCNYNIYKGTFGSGTAGGTAVASKTIRQSQNLKIESSDIINELLDQVSDKIASLIDAQNKSGQIQAKQNASAEVVFECMLSDFTFPEVVLENGKYVVRTGTIPVSIKYITIDIDGIAQNAGEKITLSKGIHVVRVNQKDIEPFEKTINVTGQNGQKFYFTLSLSDSALARLKNDMAFIEAIKERAKASDNRRILTKAEAECLRGTARMLEQSGYKIDIDKLPETKVQSIFGQ